MFIINAMMAVSNWLWGWPLLILTVVVAVVLTIKYKGFQFRFFGHSLKNTLGKIFEKSEGGEGNVTPFQACCTALASTLGVGNIAGVSVAIATGGPGAIFWMWAVALMGLIVKFTEISLGMAYREKDPETGVWHGGFYWTVRKGLGKHWTWLGCFWAIILGCAMVFAPAVQSNSIVSAINSYFDVKPVIIGIIILFAVLLTWIIPAGSYTRFENEAGIKVIDPNDFNYIDKTPVNPLEIPLYIVKAFIKRIDLMLVIMFAGGAFHILTKTGALHAVVAKMAKIFSTRVYLFLPILTLVFGLICTTQGVNLFIAFAPIMVMMAFAMGLDSITGASIILLGGAIGFSTGPLNINTTIVAQKIAGLPLYSGVGYRFICFAVFYVITNIYLIRYALKIQKHPELSPMYEIDKTSEFRNAADLDSFGKLDARKILIMLVFFASLILIVYGGIKLDWDMSETASVFLALAVIEGVLGGFGPSAISKEFLEGCKKMLGAAFIIGMAQAISSIMNAGHITDTVVHALANGLNFVPTILLGPAMLLANTIINVFLTSGSGQAAAVIPILARLADLVGVTRQTAILSFNFGDGFCNYVLPTSTALMGIISAVNIPYDRWMKFMWKLFLIWLAVGSVLLMIAQAIHLGPM